MTPKNKNMCSLIYQLKYFTYLLLSVNRYVNCLKYYIT